MISAWYDILFTENTEDHIFVNYEPHGVLSHA